MVAMVEKECISVSEYRRVQGLEMAERIERLLREAQDLVDQLDYQKAHEDQDYWQQKRNELNMMNNDLRQSVSKLVPRSERSRHITLRQQVIDHYKNWQKISPLN